jgi:hypothetical protein
LGCDKGWGETERHPRLWSIYNRWLSQTQGFLAGMLRTAPGTKSAAFALTAA